MRKILPLLVLAAAGCDATREGLGDVNSIIVVADTALWDQVSDTVLSTLQPEVFAVRDEPTFNLTHTTYGSEHWSDLRRFRQLLVIGRPTDPWLERPLEVADTTLAGPGIVEVNRVWARNQRVTAVVVPEAGAAEFVASRVDTLAALLDRRYRNWARTRMYISGHGEALADTLRREGGFALDMPQVYRWRAVSDSAYVFINDNPDASQLVRWLTVTWKTGGEGSPTREELVEWRDSLAASFYDWGQTTQRDRFETRPLSGPGDGGIEVRGAWSGTLDDYPQAGPFITRVIDCPGQNRRYLLDTWLYAPTRDKYQYMIQLETLLESFECGADRGSAHAGSA